jgi:phosphoglycolate phosphatase
MTSEPTWPRAILFDLDGTLIDSVPDIAAAANTLVARDGLAPFTDADVRVMIGHGLKTLVQRAFAARNFGLDEAGLTARFETMRGIYMDNLTNMTVLMPGAAEFIAGGGPWRLALVTNKPQAPTDAIMAHFGLTSSFAQIVGERGLRLKPEPDMLLFAVQELGLTAADAVMVGDSGADIASARAAGMASIAVRGGYTIAEPESLGADLVIDSLHDLRPALAGWRMQG